MYDEEQWGFPSGEESGRTAEEWAADHPAGSRPHPDTHDMLARILGPALYGGWTDCRPGEVGK